MGQLNHSSINVTMDICCHLIGTINQKAVNRLGKTVWGNSKEQILGEDGIQQVMQRICKQMKLN
jgi:hypothetical protein